MPDTTLNPRDRLELFLKAIKDADASDLPEPETREEIFLKAIAEQLQAIKAALPDGGGDGE